TGNEIENEVVDDFRPVLTAPAGADLAIEDQIADVPVPPALRLEPPEEVLVEAEAIDAVSITAELPFSSDGGGVSQFAQVVTERPFLGFQPAEGRVVADIILPGHELDPRGRAERL